MGCAFCVALCNMFYPMITREIINTYVPNRELPLMFLWAGMLLVIYLFMAGMSYFIQYYGHT